MDDVYTAIFSFPGKYEINWVGFVDGNNGDQPIYLYLLYLKYPNMWH
jgi:hypothetical protein